MKIDIPGAIGGLYTRLQALTKEPGELRSEFRRA
jgi:hypothetical protein